MQHTGLNCISVFFFFNDTATTEIYTLSLHDALPIFDAPARKTAGRTWLSSTPWRPRLRSREISRKQDRKSTRLNSSHLVISYAVFCLKKKNTADALKPQLRIDVANQSPVLRPCHSSR